MKKLQRYLPAGALGVSLLLHLAILFGISGVILIQAVTPKIVPVGETTLQAIPQDLPPPPDLPDDPVPTPAPNPANDSAEPKASVADFLPQQIAAQTAPVPMLMTPANVIANPANSMPIQANSPAQNSPAKEQSSGIPKISPFGSSDIRAGGLEGYFYDMKLTSSGKPTKMTVPEWDNFATKFANSNWSETALKNFYKSPNPLYIRQFFIPLNGSLAAPKAFNIHNAPALWMILYHGYVIPPEDGTYTFHGYGDDLLLVKINDRLVLDAGWLLTTVTPQDLKTFPRIWSPHFGKQALLRVGKPFTVKKDVPVKIDVLIGDHGGYCAFFLMIKKEGESYEKLDDGTLKLPIFQLADLPLDTSAPGDYPPFSTKKALWQQAAQP